jgi:hypothetical protein
MPWRRATACSRPTRASPGNPLIQVGLASAWAALGYDGRAAAAAQAAFDASATLNREDRLNVEGRLHEAQLKWTNAVDVYGRCGASSRTTSSTG